MLRELIAWVLNNYLGKYVENLNTAQLTIALLSGQVELENLPLRKDALRYLGLPLQIINGTIGKVKLTVPVRAFRTASWCLNIDNVNVVCGPIDLNEWNSEIEQQTELDFKIAALDRLEAKWRAQRETPMTEGSYYASSYSGWLSYGTSLVTKIIENLQLKVTGIHIRYEDGLTIPNQTFACGINIEALSAQSCDSNWQPGQTSNWSQQQVTFKLVELTNFAIYWDPLSRDEQIFVISPISAKAQMKRDRSDTPLRTRSRPRLVCDLIWDEIKITLSDVQYNQMMQCVRGLDDIARYRRFKLSRPNCNVADDPKAWWYYAIRCHGLLRHSQIDPFVIAKENLRYIDVYNRVVSNPNEVLSSENKCFKDRIERERDFDELRLLRDVCMMRVPTIAEKSPAQMNQGKSMLVHFFPQWLGWYNNNNESPTDSTPPSMDQIVDNFEANWGKDQELSPSTSFEDEILNALADSVDTNSLLKRDAVFGKFNFVLKRGTMDFCSGIEMTPMLQFQFQNLKLDVETRPRSGSHYLSLSLGSILIKDRLTPNSQFADLVKPQAKEDQLPLNPKMGPIRSRSQSMPQNQLTEPIFEVQYERKPLSYDTDYRLMVKSQSLDIVYNTDAVKWLIDFLMKPHQQYDTRRKLEDMKNRTKMEFVRNWKNILEGHLNARKTWTLEFDIFAPQIIFVDNFADRQNSTIVVVDFGRLQLTNGNRTFSGGTSDKINNITVSPEVKTENDEEDAFMTPCSTPPGSEASTTNSPTLESAFSELPELNPTNADTLDEHALYQKLYDRYQLRLTDLQVLVCRGKERWNFASTKGTSTLHVLDRFSISLEVERRVVYTSDPQYPSLTLSGILPKLNAHINEYKLSTLLTLIDTFTRAGSLRVGDDVPDATGMFRHESDIDANVVVCNGIETDSSSVYRQGSANIVVFQFSIDQLSLEVQSRGRSIVELQVTGVKAGYSKRPEDVTLTLSVHGLLLADAMQSFGPDFELLIASHRHVGMDSLSGSLRQSEPCSPCSPGSPDPNMESRRPTSPLTISKALSNLQKVNSPTWNAAQFGDLDALITVEVIFVNSSNLDDRLQVANIQFNNLDIIANQETIVELVGFIKRVIPKQPTKPDHTAPTQKSENTQASTDSLTPIVTKENESDTSNLGRTEITFDFHRLNVLILRALMRDNYLVGRKVGTFTMSEAKIHASLGAFMTVEGSLGGLQVLDLTPEGINHQRILSVGKDPLTDPPTIRRNEPDLMTSLAQEVYGVPKESTDGLVEERQALSFSVSKDTNAIIDVRVKMASVWFIHCARFMQELSWCASEFKHYLKNLARSIRDKATDMALGLVQSRSDLSSSRSESIYNSPRKTRRQRTVSLSKTQEVFLNAEYTLKVDITLETPVLILPRSSSSTQVLVAHLGKITVSNTHDHQNIYANTTQNNITTIIADVDEAVYNLSDPDEILEPSAKDADSKGIRFGKDQSMEFVDSVTQNFELYKIDIKNINLYSLDTINRKGFRYSALPRAEEFYSCKENAIPIIHDTIFSLEISRESVEMDNDCFRIFGCVVKPLRVSLKRQQYEQLLETIDNVFKIPRDLVRPPAEASTMTDKHPEILEESTFNAYPISDKVRRGLMYQNSFEERPSSVNIKVNFELPTFIIQLNDGSDVPQIQISFKDFSVMFEKRNVYETHLEISLRSIMMEDLLQPDTAKNRYMVVSSSQNNQFGRPATSFASHSCPNLAGLLSNIEELPNSLPNNLNDKTCFYFLTANKTLCPDTPPPSPSIQRQQNKTGTGEEANLVIYTSIMVDPSCPTFATQFNSLQQCSSIDFNSLDLIVSVESWFVLLNFFGLLNDGESSSGTHKSSSEQMTREKNLNRSHTQLDISVRSLSLVLAKPDYEIAKANVSNANFTISQLYHTKQVEGRLGSITLSDLTPYGFIYREKFMTTGNEALSFVYIRDAEKSYARNLQKDAVLKIEMSSVRFVHTKRFIAEIQLFFKEFSQLQTPVMRKIKPTDSRPSLNQRPTQLGLEINAGAPILIFPMAFNSDQVIIADLGEFTLKNEFRMSDDPEVISVSSNDTVKEVLDVMHVNLFHTNIFAANRIVKPDEHLEMKHFDNDIAIDMKCYLLVKQGPSLLKDKCHLKLQVERNMDSWNSHFVPDISVHGTLSRLEAVLDLQQYRLVRGFLSYNLGESLDELYLRPMYIANSTLSLNTDSDPLDELWKNLSIHLELQDVSVRLEALDIDGKPTPLACINFIKSKLLVDSLSDGAQDIDLVSQEILIKDTRSDVLSSPDAIGNVFSNILQPIVSDFADGQVQAEIHSRRRQDLTKFTILLNNMRLMAILDWLESAKDFILQQEEQPQIGLEIRNNKRSASVDINKITPVPSENNRIELKLNITDSELVLVEKTDQHDTNAVILKSTTVVSYRPFETAKILSINLNNLEVFSCVLGSEDGTALSIIDPITVNMDLRQGVLDVQMQRQLCIRLSYHDVKMFQRMLESLPGQTKFARDSKQASVEENTEASTAVEKLILLGFNRTDCLKALEKSNYQIDEAALWLTQNSEPSKYSAENKKMVEAIELKASCISICIIDDCRDADVPFVELSLNKLDLRQEMGQCLPSTTADVNDLDSTVAIEAFSTTFAGYKAGRLTGVFASDYYNRALSGWEPLIEPWKVDTQWGYSLGQTGASRNRLNLKVESNDTLRLNVTSTLIELYQLVKENWIQDYYNSTNSACKSPVNYRRRTPFVPFAIKNDTGVKLWYTTVLSSESSKTTVLSDPDTQWSQVDPGGTASFSYASESKQRHRDTHKLNLHQIAVRVDGWQEVGPISVDRVGTFFRHARPDLVDDYSQAPRARIVFAVSLEGSAQKLITVQSALKLTNKLDNPVLVKMEHLYGHLNIRNWPDTHTQILHSNEILNIPLTHVHAILYFRPLPANVPLLEDVSANQSRSEELSISSDGWTLIQKFDIHKSFNNNNGFQFTDKGIRWNDAIETNELYQELRTCRGLRERSYKMLVSIRKEAYPSKDVILLPGHSITLWPPLRIHNLLPCDLLYKLPSGTQGRISATKTAKITEIDMEQPVMLTLTLDSYPEAGQITIPAGFYGSTELDVRLFDTKSRMLKLRACVCIIKGRGIQISISAPFWLVNRTGIPLVFRQDDLDSESSGQFSENEQARMISPFMFAFSDPSSSGCLTMRLGRRFGQGLQWCQPFKLEQGIKHRQLVGGKESFIIGIEVRRARGRYNQTSIVTFSPRYQLYNRSSYKLQVLQKCFTDTVYDPAAKSAYIEAVPGCHIAFHWPRLDKEQELCVRLPDVHECLWSAGIPIFETQSLYINIRTANGAMQFLRLETILQGATYFMIFSDAQSLPPPIRLDNYSEVPIRFHQAAVKHQFKTTVRPRNSMAYVLDEPLGNKYLQIEAPGGDFENCSLNGFDNFRLTYENFIYIAFSQTFESTPSFEYRTTNDLDVKSQQLVLGVIDGRVVLVRKQAGDRSQLWRMNHEKQLEHEGSSPPSEPGKKQARFVLDLEKPPQPMQFINLVVRPSNRQRRSTQTWRFTEEGRLMCEHSNMCVQAKGGIFGLQIGSEAGLGMCVSETKALNRYGVPYDQAIERQKLRPGSGCLSVTYRMDGPIKCIQIKDVKNLSGGPLALDNSWKHVSHILNEISSRNLINEHKQFLEEQQEYYIVMKLRKGIGFSLISNQPCEELAYVTLEDINMELISTINVFSLDFSVGDMQIDNQLFETSCPIALYTIPPSSNESPNRSSLSSLQLNIKLLPSPNTNAIIFEHFILSIRPVAVYLEERLILRLVKFTGLAKSPIDLTALPDESDYEAQKIVYKVLDANVKRYYFGDLQIVPSQIRLSFITASKLAPEFAEVKRNLGFTFIKFEDAIINFDKFTHKCHFETMDAYLHAIKSHYKQELKWQAASILGSVDFLGNPLGFANDLTEGVSGLLLEGSISSLVKNVTHGISNSTAKLTETISDGLGKVVFDDEHVEARQKILDVSGGSGSTTGDHLVAGFKGFTFGLLGGVTSVVKHTYNGTVNDGFSGFITGLGKGLVGTVTKPVIGVLDLASETANAVREQSKSSSRILPERKRHPRVVTGAPGGLLPPYSSLQSKGQQYLFLINKRNFNEQFMAYEPCLLDTKESKMRLLVSADHVWGFSKNEDTTTIVFHYRLSEIISCQLVTVPAVGASNEPSSNTTRAKKTTTYIEFCLMLPSKSLTPSAPEMVKRPRVRCQNEDIAKKICHHINFAKCIYDEREQTLNSNAVIEP
ncbi:intermembrane lipid transfer protein Vps13D isoform X2 [Wyeomyia smithii]|uniref:intermembrane lipid transfer protein Vps13D isoform X2 n=1 Tax=Wyeomyia smithii TaxID=174621 RepID=UPI00246814A0|nr:intermembrane lipid transfer protein Vps13D isoform X2 [Wyeomyia smithii]